MANEYAGAGIRVNGIICGTFDTDATVGFVHNPDLLPDVLSPIPLKRVGATSRNRRNRTLSALRRVQLHHRIAHHRRRRCRRKLITTAVRPRYRVVGLP
jgi:NAD(P)-dependent dehydrogenase (short-subunit alcohol dehydrogenase family)